MSNGATGTVFNIQRYSIHDGGGIRTLVFLKGCPLRCKWCCNPESQSGAPQLGYMESRCAGARDCGASCIAACPPGAVGSIAQGKVIINRARCDACGECAAACGKGALKIVGRAMTVAQVMAEVEKDRPFYRRSGGGITVGGGEPLAQYQFAAALLEAARRAYINTALETCGHAPWPHLSAVLQHVDLLQFDIKHMDAARHRELTGVSNDLILDNLRKVRPLKEPRDVIIRIPVVPGCNDSEENIRSTVDFATEIGYKNIELVPYHRMGTSKYAQYGMGNPLDRVEPPQEAGMARLREIVSACGAVDVGGSI